MTPTAARVIYPELPDPLTPGDLQQLFSPSFDERQWAPTVARTAVSQVALLVQLKIFQTIGRFRRAADVPPAVIEHVALRLGVESGSTLIFPDRTLYRHRPVILKRLEVGSICFRCNLSRFGFEHWRRGSYRRSLIPLAFQATLQSGLCGVKP